METSGEFLVLAFAWGALLGLFYFGGLWLTLKSLTRLSRPRAAFFASYALRVAAALSGMGLALNQGPTALFHTLAAFFGVRVVMTGKVGRAL